MRGESKGEVDGGEYGFNRFYDKGITPLTNHYYIFAKRGIEGDSGSIGKHPPLVPLLKERIFRVPSDRV